MIHQELAYKLVIFDLDGTLIDTAPIVLTLLNSLRKQRGLPPKNNLLQDNIISSGGNTLISKTLGLDPENNRKEIKKYLQKFRTEYSQIDTDEKLVYPNVKNILREMNALQLKSCVCTNKPRHLALKTLKDTNLFDYFEDVLCADDLKTAKPDPRLIEYFFNRFPLLRNNVVLIGDSILDYYLAKNAGIDFIFYAGGYHGNEPELADQINFTAYSELIPLLSRKTSKQTNR